MNKKKICKLVLTVIILTISIVSAVNGQPPSPPGGHGLNGDHGPGGFAPIDGGIFEMILGVIAYAIVKLLRAKRKVIRDSFD